MLEGKKTYNRDAPKEDVDKLKLLKGHVKKGQFVTKLRKVFNKDEMGADLELVRRASARRTTTSSTSRFCPPRLRSALSTLGFWGAVLARVRENPRSGERGYPKIKR